MADGKYQKWLEPDNLILLEGWRRDGLDMEQIAANMGIKRGTLYNWCTKFDEIKNALKRGTEVSVYMIENEMYESAKNRYVEELEVIEQAIYDSNTGEKLQIVNRTTKKHRRFVPANTSAQIFILKNRRADWWREKQVVETNADGMLAALIDGLKEPEKDETKDDLHEETT